MRQTVSNQAARAKPPAGRLKPRPFVAHDAGGALKPHAPPRVRIALTTNFVQSLIESCHKN